MPIMNESDSSDDERPRKRKREHRHPTTQVAATRTVTGSKERGRYSIASLHDNASLPQPDFLLHARQQRNGNIYGNINIADNAAAVLGDVHYSGNIPKLRYNPRATFDAYGQTHTPCHPATRVDLLHEIREWAQHSDSKPIFWLNGMAGTGKSTVAFTVAQWLEQQEPSEPATLGASFFFKRGDGDRASAAHFFSTIVYQLQQKIPGLKLRIDKVLKDNPDICAQAIRKQFNKLIENPLQELGSGWQKCIYIVVVDALDECDNENDIRAMLELWPYLFSMVKIGLRLFLTSRPELLIRLGFSQMSVDVHQDIILHRVNQQTIEHDIFVYLKDNFQQIRHEYNLEPLSGVPLPAAWPGDIVLRDLVSLAVPLFIIAATICRFVQDRECDPEQQLKTILTSRRFGHRSHMMGTYLPVLQQIASPALDTVDRQRVFEEFRLIVGAVVVLAKPLSRNALALLLDKSPGTIALRLRPLHSVLSIPMDADTPIRPLHLSFGEFLTSPDSQGQSFHIDKTAIHRALFNRCLALLSRPSPIGLCENMCQLDHPGQSVSEVPKENIEERLSSAIAYACHYWFHHARQSQIQFQDDDQVYCFLRLHLLHWLEAMALTSEYDMAIGLLSDLQDLVQESPHDTTSMLALLADAACFHEVDSDIAQDVPLQLYSSAIIFSSPKGIVQERCMRTPTWIEQCNVVPAACSDLFRSYSTKRSADSTTHKLVYSVNGTLLASFFGQTVRLWNAVTGKACPTQRTKPQRWGASLTPDKSVFSPDNSGFAAVANTIVCLWHLTTDEACEMLLEHDEEVTSLAFSNDGSQLASATQKGTVALRNRTTGQIKHKLKAHHDTITMIVFSPDDTQLASASYDWSVRLWNTVTGQMCHVLKGHSDWVMAVAFSTDGTLLASACDDETIRLWNPMTGQLHRTLKGHESWIDRVTFSPCSSILASASHDGTIRLWDSGTGRQIHQLERPEMLPHLIFTRDGQNLLAGCASFPVNSISVSSDMDTTPTDLNELKVVPWDAWGSDDHTWIHCAGKRLLWLPRDYESHTWATYGNQIALARKDGEVKFLRIRYS